MSRHRFLSWFTQHRTFIIDSAVAVLLMTFWTSFSQSTMNDTGLILEWDSQVALVWAFLLTVPYAIHRTRPALAVNFFLGTVVAQLFLGPSMVFADTMSLPMLYSALVYGPIDRTRIYLRWAGILGSAEALINAIANNTGSLLQWVRLWTQDTPVRTSLVCSPTSSTLGVRLPRDCTMSILGQFIAVGIFIMAALIMVTVAAFWQRARRQTVLLLEERNRAIEQRQQEEERIAASAERARIARDMHDVVAHTLSIIIVQADGGRYAAVNDPEMTCATMETIRTESEHALHDMKRLLGVFGGSAHAGYTDIAMLLEQARQVSPDMTIVRTVEGIPQSERLTQQASITLYHAVQEALTNVRKYAGRQVEVTIHETWNDDTVTVSVHDDGRGAAAALDGHQPGLGLLGMRERVEHADGDISAGPALGGGFTVTITLPLHTSADANKNSEQVTSANALSQDSATGNAAATANDDIVLQSTSTTDSDTLPAAQADKDHRFNDYSMPAWISRLGELRSQPFEQAEDGAHSNWVTRLSHWTERHYVLTDTLLTLLLIAFLIVNDLGVFVIARMWDYPSQPVVVTTVTILLMLPLCLRRRFPRAVAIVYAILTALQLIFLPSLYSADLFALLAIYTCVLYGHKREWLWLTPAIVLMSALTGLKITLTECGFPTIMSWITGNRYLTFSFDTTTMYSVAATSQSALETGIQFTTIIAMVCMIALLLGAWARQKGENPQILQARADALQAEAEKQRIMAANRERDRISAEIQTEVSETLHTVIDQTSEELDSIHVQLAAGQTPTPQSISEAFSAIAARGRTALAHMRMLLRVLRDTGFSDDHEDQDHHMTMPLSPIAGTRTTADHTTKVILEDDKLR